MPRTKKVLSPKQLDILYHLVEDEIMDVEHSLDNRKVSKAQAKWWNKELTRLLKLRDKLDVM